MSSPSFIKDHFVKGFSGNHSINSIVIKCAKCRSEILKYLKIGKGRIIEDTSVRDGSEVKCHCGNLIGIDEGRWIKMKQRSFTYSGTRTKG